MRRATVLWLFLVGGLVTVLVSARNPPDQAATGTNQELRATPREGKRVPVTVELFTSEGCPSCPPADALLARLTKDQPVPGVEIIAMGEHVDYWNRLGWKDVYSSAAISRRQREYAQAFRTESVYTPQMVVDGQTEFVGSDGRRALEAIAAAARAPKLGVQVTRLENKTGEGSDKFPLQIRVDNMPAVGAGNSAEVLLAVTEDELDSNVTRGENAGRRLQHAAVVRQFESIDKLDLRAGRDFVTESMVTIRPEWKRENLHALVLVQERHSRRILGAAAIDLAAATSPSR